MEGVLLVRRRSLSSVGQLTLTTATTPARCAVSSADAVTQRSDSLTTVQLRLHCCWGISKAPSVRTTLTHNRHEKHARLDGVPSVVSPPSASRPESSAMRELWPTLFSPRSKVVDPTPLGSPTSARTTASGSTRTPSPARSFRFMSSRATPRPSSSTLGTPRRAHRSTTETITR